ncbi:MAG TPA: hypothetical protein VGG02_02065 [Chthoniobacterales bacterium]|jgi:hypothetical protein
MLFGLFITLGIAALSVALRSYESPISQKIGALGIVTATFLGVYYITDNWIFGLAVAFSWLLLPWVEILTRIRALRLPREKMLRPKSPPSSDVFPTLDEISKQIESEGFTHVADAGWDWADYRQFFRLFYKADDRAQAAICLNEQHDLSFYYLRISSRTEDGMIWTTWNYPLSYGLKLTPQFRINRQRPDQSFWQLYQSHKNFLREHAVETARVGELDEDQIQAEMENDLRDQITHNLAQGVLTQTPGGEIKYSWRGMFYLWCQFLLDLVRM